MAGFLRLHSLNIDKRNNLGRVLEHYRKIAEISGLPDVLCVQEVMEIDLELFAPYFAEYFYEPMTRDKRLVGPSLSVGVAMFLRGSVRSKHRAVYYYHDPFQGQSVQDHDIESVESRRQSERRLVLSAGVEKDGVRFNISTTHFTWVPDGKSDDYQRRDVERMISMLQDEGEIVLCGDFNAPRGGEIQKRIEEVYRDNVPEHWISTIDPHLHRIRGLKAVVDGVFSSPSFQVTYMRCRYGISDHGLISCKVTKRKI